MNLAMNSAFRMTFAAYFAEYVLVEFTFYHLSSSFITDSWKGRVAPRGENESLMHRSERRGFQTSN